MFTKNLQKYSQTIVSWKWIVEIDSEAEKKSRKDASKQSKNNE
jgi:hypothetical protein